MTPPQSRRKARRHFPSRIGSSGEVAQLEVRLLRRATGLVVAAGVAMRIVEEFEKSLKKYPPITPGTADPYTSPSVNAGAK